MQMNLFEKDKGDNIILKMPQYEVNESKLYFMNFRKKNIGDNLLEAFKKIEDGVTVKSALDSGINIDTLMELEEKKCILIVEANRDNYSKEKVLVLAPHVDDAAFGLGGTISKYKMQKDFYILNIFGRQDFTLYWKNFEQSRNHFYQIEEEKVFWKAANIKKGVILDYEDAPLRESYKNANCINSGLSTEYILQKEMSLYESVYKSIKDAIILYKPDIILCPVGNGRHVDHILVREACLKINLNKEKLYFYEDMPYSVSFGGQQNREEIACTRKCILKSRRIEIKEDILEKKRYLSIYQSQIKNFQIKAILDYSRADGTAYEMLWELF